MKKIICLLGLIAITSCSHYGKSNCGSSQCSMKKEKCAECCNDKKQFTMDKMAPATEAEVKK
jgi:hypothetical protein